MKKNTPRIVRAFLTAFAFAFTFFFFGAAEIFAGNKSEFLFAFSDFAPYLALITAAVFAVTVFILIIVGGKVGTVLSGLFFGITLMGYIQGNFLGSGSSLGGDTGAVASAFDITISVLMWLAAVALCVFLAILAERRSAIRHGISIVLLLLCGMQLTAFITMLPSLTREAETDSEPTEKMYLTSAGITEVSRDNNIIVFIVDQFDKNWYTEIVTKNPDFFTPLDGFTYFDDNISYFSRTYPAAANMITGIDQDFSRTAQEYFEYAYKNSPFLIDLQKNDYEIKLFTDDYYSYRDAAPLRGIAENISGVTEYEITDTERLVGNMLKLSLYRYLPLAAKGSVEISSASFEGLVSYLDAPPMYEMDDAALYSTLKQNGLSTDKTKNGYTFLHLNGCHPPASINENCENADGVTTAQSCMGSFKLIYFYLDELKRLDLYKDATIVITGDHPNGIGDAVYPTFARQTTLFVKPSGSADTPLSSSTAQVSQENFLATLVSSAGIKTENDYGKTYFDISEGVDTIRHQKFESKQTKDLILYYEIIGDGSNFSNWHLLSETDIGKLYK